MSPERWRQVEELFHAASARPSRERAAFLDQACANDAPLRREVDVLLASDREEDGEFEKITSRVAAGWVEESHGHDLLGKTIGRYEILQRLGSGGMGEVYLAQDTMLDRKVALKLLPKQFTQDRERVRRFEQEARAASALNHPNIITIYEVGEWDGARFIATEYVEGQTLREMTEISGRPLSKVLDIGIQASGALAAAHDAGIVHRDIKPANIMLRRDGYIKVLDFGLAKLARARVRPDVTELGRVIGTINYMSPEQAMGKPLDHRTDIFSLGVVLYEIAAGHRLFDGKSEAAIYDRILHEPVPSMRQFAPAIPVELDQVLRRALEKDPARRYQTASDLRIDLKRLAEGTGTTEAARAVRRSRYARITALAGLAAVLLGAGIFVSRHFTHQPQAILPNESSGKSIAVLPFVDLSQAKDQEYICDGISEEILASLAKVPGLRVAARTSSFSFKGSNENTREIGRKLGVQEILTGSVRRDENHIRLTAQLINARDGFNLWSETFDRDLKDVFAVQDEITRAIVAKLQMKSSSTIASAPVAAEAHDLYLRGLYFSNKSGEADLRKALAYFQQALDREPNYSNAWSGMAKVWGWLADEYIKPLEAYPAMAAAASKALETNPNDEEARCSLVEAQWFLNWDLNRSEQDMQKALAAGPNSPTAHWLAAFFETYRGDFPAALEQMHIAQRLDPLSPIITNIEANMLIWDNRLDEALAVARRTIELDPKYAYSGPPLARIYIAQGAFDKAIAFCEKEAQTSHHSSYDLAIAYAGAHRETDARKILGQLLELRKTRYYGADLIARVYAALGDSEQTLAWLDTAYNEHSANLPSIAFHRQFSFLHADPRFRDLLRKIGLDPATLLDREPTQ